MRNPEARSRQELWGCKRGMKNEGECSSTQVPQTATRARIPGCGHEHRSLLIVDDSPQIRRALRTILFRRDLSCVDARTGEEALDLIRKERVELILLDVNLPGMSGIETCREIRRASETPVIMLTVRRHRARQGQAFDAGRTISW